MDTQELDLDFKHLTKALKDYANEVRALYRKKLILDDKFATGKLIQNMKVDVKVGSYEMSAVLYLEDYWKYVEEGRRPGKRWPPRDKILEWIKIKPILPEPDKNGNLPTPEQLSYLIQRKIGISGITAGHQLATTIQEVNSWYLPQLQLALQQDFEDAVIKIFNKVGELIKI